MKLNRSFLARLVRAAPAFLGLPILAFGAHGAESLPDLDIQLKAAWPPCGRATVQAIAAVGRHAYLAVGEAGLLVLDVSEPRQPRHVGALPLAGFSSGLAIAGDYLFVANRGVGMGTNHVFSGLDVIDVRNPDQPRAVAKVAMPGPAVNVAVSGSRAVVVDEGIQTNSGRIGAGVEVFDLETPLQPRRLGRIEATGEVGAMAAADGIACFFEEGAGSLSVIDLAGADGPRRLGQYRVNGYSFLALKDRHAFLAGGEYIEVVDLTDPSQPKSMGEAIWLEGGNSGGWLIDGQFAYTGAAVLDLSNPRKLTQVGRVEGGVLTATLALTGGMQMRIGSVPGGFGREPFDFLKFIDVSDPRHPQTVSTLVTESRAWDVALSGSLAYVANGFAGLQIVDVSNPGKPQRLADHLTDGEVRRVAVAGKYACHSTYNGISVVDVSDPRNPRNRGVYPLEGWASNITMVGDRIFLFVEGATRSLEVLDLSDPDRPRRMLRLNEPALLPASPQFQYTPDATEGWTVHDVSDPGNPLRVGSYRAMVKALGGVLVGNQVHTHWGDVFDVSDPAHPRRVGSIYPTIQARSGSLGCTVEDSYALSCYDLSNPAVPRLIGRYTTGDRAWAVELRGTDAFIAAGTAGLQIVDLSRSSRLVRTPGSAISALYEIQGLTPTGSGTHLAHGGERLQIFDLADLAQPRRLGGLFVKSRVTDVAISRHHAYVAEAGTYRPNREPTGGRLSIIDLSDPSRPRETGALPLVGTATAVAVSGTTAFVAARSQGLLAVDVSDPTHPVEAGRLNTGGFANDVAMAGSYALVAGYPTALQIVDIAQPSQLRSVAEYRGAGAYHVDVAGDRAYVWTAGGLLLFDITDPARPQFMNHHGALAMNDAGDGLASASIVGDYVFMVNVSGLEVFDFKDPSHPRLIARNSAVDGWSSLLSSGDTILVHEGDGDAGGVRSITMPPFFRAVSRTDGGIRLEWEGWGRARLQRSAAADSSAWQDVPGTESLTRTVLPLDDPNVFIRLYQP